jgi:hypothetical protein
MMYSHLWISVGLAITTMIESAPVPGGVASHGLVLSGSPLDTSAHQNLNAFTHNAFVPNYHYEPASSPSSEPKSVDSLKSNREKSWLKEATHQPVHHEAPRSFTRKPSFRVLRHLSSPPHLAKRMLSRANKKAKSIETPEGPVSKPIPVPDNYRHMTSPIDEDAPLDTTHLPDVAEHEYSSSFGSHSYGSQNHRHLLSNSMSGDSTTSASSMKRISKFHDLHALGEALQFHAPKSELHIPRISFHKRNKRA